jgi:TolA-binding protein
LTGLMNPKLKLTAYAVLLILCAWFAWGFYASYTAVTDLAADDGSSAPLPLPDSVKKHKKKHPITTNSVAKLASTSDTNASTNIAAASDTNSFTNTVATSDANSAANVVPAPDTNVTGTSGANVAALPDTNSLAGQTNAPAPAPVATQPPAPEADASSKRSSMISYLIAFIGSIVGLGLLIAYDATQFAGSRAVDFLFNDAGEGQRDPEYERAESAWANGKHLEAIQMMRDFLMKHPREIYAALRIAEIYEKDLKNYLAAVLEYEEILKHKLPPERWGWAAIHLCNLYSKINQSDKAVALLRRVAEEYPKTAAAKKARARLGIAEPEPEEVPEEAEAEPESERADGSPIIYMEERPPELEPRAEAPVKLMEPTVAPEAPKPSLPPGFRKKK